MGRAPEGKAEKMFKRFGKNVDSIITDFKESENFRGLNIEKRVSELNKNMDSLGHHFGNVSDTVKTHFEEAKPNLERAGQELRKAMNTFFSNRAYK